MACGAGRLDGVDDEASAAALDRAGRSAATSSTPPGPTSRDGASGCSAICCAAIPANGCSRPRRCRPRIACGRAMARHRSIACSLGRTHHRVHRRQSEEHCGRRGDCRRCCEAADLRAGGLYAALTSQLRIPSLTPSQHYRKETPLLTSVERKFAAKPYSQASPSLFRTVTPGSRLGARVPRRHLFVGVRVPRTKWLRRAVGQ